MDNKEAASILSEISILLELKGENPFKVRAYQNAARVIEGYAGDLGAAVGDGSIREVQGIGSGIAEKLEELAKTGKLGYYEELKRSIPEGHLEMLRIPGMGPKKVRAVYEKLGIRNIGELEYACHENRLLDLPGFGRKSQENILRGIEFLKKYRERFLLGTVLGEAEALLEAVLKSPAVKRGSLAGSIRRKLETVKDIDIVCAADDSAPVMESFVSGPGVETVIAKGETKASVKLASGINVDLRAVSDGQFPYALHHFTGSREHNIAMRGRAQKRGLKMNEYGLFRGEELIRCRTEEEIFRELGLQFIPPELREDRGEIEAAERGEIPKLVAFEDLRGPLHVHSDWSDGVNTLAEVAAAARERGWAYVGIADHSKSAAYAGGLTEERVREQQEEIDALNRKVKGVRLLKGTEVDILPDGSLDYPDAVLAAFDFVVASVHSRFTMPEKEMTARICRALQNPHVNVLGHPTGRLLLSREAYPVDLEEVIRVAAKHRVAVELNSHPQRLDIDWREIRHVKSYGGRVSINPDAHNIAGMDDMAFGVGIARKGWLGADDVINTLALERLLQFFNKKKK
jgi:DNA polymerase (family 10)